MLRAIHRLKKHFCVLKDRTSLLLKDRDQILKILLRKRDIFLVHLKKNQQLFLLQETKSEKTALRSKRRKNSFSGML